MQKSRESFVVDVCLNFKYAFGIGFTVENVYRMSVFIWYGQRRLKKFVIVFLFLELIKTCWFNSFMTEVSIIKKPVRWFALQINDRYLRHEWVNEEGVIFYQDFLAAYKLNTFKLLNKITINPNRIMVLCFVVNLSNFSTLI